MNKIKFILIGLIICLLTGCNNQSTKTIYTLGGGNLTLESKYGVWFAPLGHKQYLFYIEDSSSDGMGKLIKAIESFNEEYPDEKPWISSEFGFRREDSPFSVRLINYGNERNMTQFLPYYDYY